MINQLNINMSDELVVGKATPDPIRYAFERKISAHAGGWTKPVSPESTQSVLCSALTENEVVSGSRCLYVHIPFCRVRCTYCNFFQNASSSSLIDEYFSALLAEIEWKSRFDWSQAAPFQAVYIGGGTPTDLSAKQLKILGKKLRESFPLTPDCEITLEGRLNRFDDEKFEGALEGGFNRFSFGVQSFDTKVRRAAKRLDDREYVQERLSRFTSYNAAPIVLDLLYGLPHQTLEVWRDDLQCYLESGADGVDLYQLIEMKGLPMEAMVQQGRLPMPADTQMKASMYEMGVKFMAEHFQRRLSVNHWASGNRERSIYNSLAKTTAEVLPLGSGAGGNVGGLQMMHHRKLDTYIESVKKQEFPVGMVFKSSESKESSAAIKWSFDKGLISRRYLLEALGYDLFELAIPLFKAWQKNGLVELNSDYVNLTLAGQFWSVNLAQIMIKIIEDNKENTRAA
ncbi:heme anaerobic degradation radical SAM methyltransferase ChuW/HutW [Vibrio hannami]|uniref:heme anaerobic degradation radical SAM methyltransferase ChuW/HutW n=1 Tax=Vibrio hannami TaxID=2717094 RepID=UPI00240F3E00|nr:heme anaerobic degradation radical SAM methyltransferase ChuW/HutW [Vibrio hannami]MDG3087613.1 heme anaerobic degradation radical SAM methyltransferase ChuW/HutW [Vibrio hannami]